MFQGNYTITSLNTQPTAHLAQTMTLLNMNTEELQQRIEAELANNPALAIETTRRCPSCGRELGASEVCPLCSTKKSSADSDTVVFLSPMREFSTEYTTPRVLNNGEEDLEVEDFQADFLSFSEYLLQQLHSECDALQLDIAEHLVSSLDSKGFLTIESLDVARYFHTTLDAVEMVRSMLQRSDPIGVGSVDSVEAMQVQLEVLSKIQEIPELVDMIVTEFMEELLHRRFDEIISNTDATMDEIHEVLEYIAANLNPYPANAAIGNVRVQVKETDTVYYRPDAVVRYINNDPANGLSVEVVLPYVNRIYVNSEFKQAIEDAPLIKREKWEDDLNRASLLVKCLQQRSVTMVRLMQYLVDYQKDFILHGERHLIPLTRAKVSTILGVHESTISRAVAKKKLQLPDGKIIPLSTFFSRNMSVRCVLKDIIENEEEPLSDNKLVTALKAKGYKVARRTVAKYRMMEGILPAHLRKMTPDAQHTEGLELHSAIK